MQSNVRYLALGGALLLAEVYPNNKPHKYKDKYKDNGEVLQPGALQKGIESRIGKIADDAVDKEPAALGATGRKMRRTAMYGILSNKRRHQ